MVGVDLKVTKRVYSVYNKNINKAKKNNLVFRATVLKVLSRVGCFCCCLFLRIETSIIKTLTEKNPVFL